VIFTIVPRREVQTVVDLVKESNPEAFYSVEEVDFVEKGIFPLRRRWPRSSLLGFLRPFRKGKSQG
jgi:hypothetical protein